MINFLKRIRLRTISVAAILGALPFLLEIAAGIDWTKWVEPKYAGLISMVVMIAMRLITTAPVMKDEDE